MPSILCTQIILNFQCFIFSCGEHVTSKIALHNGFRVIKVLNLINLYESYFCFRVFDVYGKKTIPMNCIFKAFKFEYLQQKTEDLHCISFINK